MFLIVIPLVGVVFLIYFFTFSKEEKKNYIKENIVVIIYFIIRIISLLFLGFDSRIIGCMVYEIMFLVFINRWTLSDYKKVKYIFIMFIVFNFIVNVCSLIVGALGLNGFISLAYNVNSLAYEFPWASVYMNPNNGGIMTAIAIILYLCIAKFKVKYIPMHIIYMAFSLFMLMKYDCRSAVMSLILCGLGYIIDKALKISKKRLIQAILIIVVLCNAALIAIINIDEIQSSEPIKVINTLSTERYIIWYDAFYTAKENNMLLLGEGSNENELENRNNYLLKEWENNGFDTNSYPTTKLGLHNGYFSILFGAGIICAILFLIIMWQKIRQAEILNEGYWYLVVIFALMVNNFEALLIMNRSYVCFIMMIILVMTKTSDNKTSKTKG
ncbi:MAG: O-antigen ligase family protein [Bacillota bacterium]|nr:O-antigen ligase family protein [Bacillota bacterium]